MTDNHIKQIADYNGMEVILNKLTEECGELITAIARYKSTEVNDKLYPEELFENVIEEAADVHILAEQLRYHTTYMFNMMREAKINRQIERMGKNDKR